MAKLTGIGVHAFPTRSVNCLQVCSATLQRRHFPGRSRLCSPEYRMYDAYRESNMVLYLELLARERQMWLCYSSFVGSHHHETPAEQHRHGSLKWPVQFPTTNH